MANLLQETLEVLRENGLAPSDVRWVGTRPHGDQVPALGTWEQFAAVADFEYDAGYGGNEIARRLVIVGGDWWLERGEYDGSEWWEFKRLPPMPTVTTQPLTRASISERD